MRCCGTRMAGSSLRYVAPVAHSAPSLVFIVSLHLWPQDTGSSNGTFINNIRLSQTCSESEPYEISSGDIVQFGVDVMENTRRETHGCITATLKLFLPDGRETKASQKVGIGGQSAIIPPVDLYRLNQYIQEANQREQILETKLISLQKMVESTR